MEHPAEFLVSSSGQMSVPAPVRHRWGLGKGGRITVIDLGDAVVLLPSGTRQRLLAEALSPRTTATSWPASTTPTWRRRE